MKLLVCVILSGTLCNGYAQFNKVAYTSAISTRNERSHQEIGFVYPNRYATKTLYQRLTSPRVASAASVGSDHTGTTYWTSNITMQSYRKGKVGTFYYWDVQGNLREMKGFVDIAGKNKRGLKLVFPWR